jgi:hypothetical protein
VIVGVYRALQVHFGHSFRNVYDCEPHILARAFFLKLDVSGGARPYSVSFALRFRYNHPAGIGGYPARAFKDNLLLALNIEALLFIFMLYLIRFRHFACGIFNLAADPVGPFTEHITDRVVQQLRENYRKKYNVKQVYAELYQRLLVKAEQTAFGHGGG